MNIFKAFGKGIERFIKTYVVVQDEEEPGKVTIITTRGRMRFSAELINIDDYNRAIDLLLEERDILFPAERELHNGKHSQNEEVLF